MSDLKEKVATLDDAFYHDLMVMAEKIQEVYPEGKELPVHLHAYHMMKVAYQRLFRTFVQLESYADLEQREYPSQSEGVKNTIQRNK